jgi:predicted extracellular nuclease
MTKTKFSVATFNLYNLNTPGAAMYTNPGWTEEQFRRKQRWISFQLTLLEADVVGCQELWSRAALERVLGFEEDVNQEKLARSYDILTTPAGADGDEISCAALVRKGLLVGEPEWIADFPEEVRLQSENDPDDPHAPHIDVTITQFSRPVLHFEVQPDADDDAIAIYVVHLKSKLPTRVDQEPWYTKKAFGLHAEALGAGISTIRRTAEAVAVRIMLSKVMKGSEAPVIVLGDINDGQHSNTANILTAQPNYLVGDAKGGSDIGLYTAQTLQEYRDTRDVYYTHIHQDIRESLDHVLVSEQFYDNSRKRRWLFKNLVINNDHLDFGNHRDSGTGDHGIVMATFEHDPR